MPGTEEEYIRFAMVDNLTHESIEGLAWEDGTAITLTDYREILLLWRYRQDHVKRRCDPLPQRRARALLRSFLTPDQRDQLRRWRYFLVHASSGHTYRIDPRRGHTERVTLHGKNWYTAFRYCLHDDAAGKMPPADLSLAHMLLLSADEDTFLQTANATFTRDQLWNRDYLSRIRTRPTEPDHA